MSGIGSGYASGAGAARPQALWKRVVSVAMSVVMAVSLMPLPGYAEQAHADESSQVAVGSSPLLDEAQDDETSDALDSQEEKSEDEQTDDALETVSDQEESESQDESDPQDGLDEFAEEESENSPAPALSGIGFGSVNRTVSLVKAFNVALLNANGDADADTDTDTDTNTTGVLTIGDHRYEIAINPAKFVYNKRAQVPTITYSKDGSGSTEVAANADTIDDAIDIIRVYLDNTNSGSNLAIMFAEKDKYVNRVILYFGIDSVYLSTNDDNNNKKDNYSVNLLTKLNDQNPPSKYVGGNSYVVSIDPAQSNEGLDAITSYTADYKLDVDGGAFVLQGDSGADNSYYIVSWPKETNALKRVEVYPNPNPPNILGRSINVTKQIYPAVAQIGEGSAAVYYASLEDAVNAVDPNATSQTTIKVIADETLTAPLPVSKNVKIEVESGKTLTMKGAGQLVFGNGSAGWALSGNVEAANADGGSGSTEAASSAVVAQTVPSELTGITYTDSTSSGMPFMSVETGTGADSVTLGKSDDANSNNITSKANAIVVKSGALSIVSGAYKSESSSTSGSGSGSDSGSGSGSGGSGDTSAASLKAAIYAMGGGRHDLRRHRGRAERDQPADGGHGCGNVYGR